MPDFLLEIGCEEIPARMIEAASQELRNRVQKLLERERLAPSGAVENLDTPRRLAVIASGIPAGQPDVTEQLTGPAVTVAYKDGQPTPAAHAFAKKAGVDLSQLGKVTTHKGEYLFTEQLTGPAVTVAYKDGQPTPAAHAFAKKAGVDLSQLGKVTTPKGEYLF